MCPQNVTQVGVQTKKFYIVFQFRGGILSLALSSAKGYYATEQEHHRYYRWTSNATHSCLEKLICEMTYYQYVSGGTLNSTHSLSMIQC